MRGISSAGTSEGKGWLSGSGSVFRSRFWDREESKVCGTSRSDRGDEDGDWGAAAVCEVGDKECTEVYWTGYTEEWTAGDFGDVAVGKWEGDSGRRVTGPKSSSSMGEEDGNVVPRVFVSYSEVVVGCIGGDGEI
jgi:hypothetical protein